MWSIGKREGEGLFYTDEEGWHLTKWNKGVLAEDCGPITVDEEKTKSQES